MDVCRICACKSLTQFRNLFDTNSDSTRELAFIHEELTSWTVLVDYNDGLPQQICANCFTTFQNILAFRTFCEERQMTWQGGGVKQEQAPLQYWTTIDLNDVIAPKEENETVDGSSKTPMPSEIVENFAQPEMSENEEMQELFSDIIELIDTDHCSPDITPILPENGVGDRSNLAEPNIEFDNVKDIEIECVDNNDTEVDGNKIRNNTLTCTYCNFPEVGAITEFKDEESLSRHFSQEHHPIKPYKCPCCSKVFRTEGHKAHHVRSLHMSIAITRCSYCLLKLECSPSVHERTCQFVGDWQCKTCHKHFKKTTLQRFRYHENEHSKHCYRCTICDRTFPHRSRMEAHKILHNAEKLTKCDLCTYAYRTLYELKRHIFQIHEGIFPAYCEKCKIGFTSINVYCRHVQLFHSKPIVTGGPQCPTCKLHFQTEQELLNHRERKVGNILCRNKLPTEKPPLYHCPHCSTGFPMKSLYEKHVCAYKKPLTGIKCQKCHEPFESVEQMDMHMEYSHHKTPMFVSQVCGPQVANQINLNKQMPSHMVDVGMSFFDESSKENYNSLNEMSTTKQKQQLPELTCEYCGKQMTLPILEEHLRQFHGVGAASGSQTEDSDACPTLASIAQVEVLHYFPGAV